MSALSGSRFLSLVFCFSALVVIGLGCSKTTETDPAQSPASDSSESKTKPRIALVMKSLANEFFSTMEKGAEKYQSENSDSFELLTNGIKDERDLSRQAAIVQEMIAQQVDAIVIAPADSKALVSVCKQAQEAGIVVVNIDNKLDVEVLKQSGITVPFVGPDNKKGAFKVGEYLATQLKEGDQVAIIEGIPTAFNAQQRKLGFEEALKAAKVNIVSSQSAQWEMAQANTVATGMLSAHPEIKAFVCCNDSMALGALASVRSADLKGKVVVVGFDNISAVQQAIKDGDILATADQHGDQLAVFGIEYALQILNEQKTPEDKETPVDLITKEVLEKE